MFWRLFLPVILFILAEYYFFNALKVISQDYTGIKKTIVTWAAWILLILTATLIGISLFYPPPLWNTFLRLCASVLFIFLICKVMCVIFMLPEDLVRLGRWVYKLFQPKLDEAITEGQKISRVKFISRLAVAFTVIPFAGFVYGMVRGAYKYRVHKVKVSAANLPEAFHGFKIVQISDMHTGSFLSTDPIKKAFDIVMQQKADVILFTGDLVNNIAAETEGFIEEYKTLKAPHGVYSVLGNHDYGDYSAWPSAEHKKAN